MSTPEMRIALKDAGEQVFDSYVTEGLVRDVTKA